MNLNEYQRRAFFRELERIAARRLDETEPNFDFFERESFKDKSKWRSCAKCSGAVRSDNKTNICNRCKYPDRRESRVIVNQEKWKTCDQCGRAILVRNKSGRCRPCQKGRTVRSVTVFAGEVSHCADCGDKLSAVTASHQCEPCREKTQTEFAVKREQRRREALNEQWIGVGKGTRNSVNSRGG